MQGLQPEEGPTVRRTSSLLTTSSLTQLALVLGVALTACESGGVGDPCIPEDEYVTTFSGFSHSEVNIESRSFQCETRVCLVANFRGRVSCPYGQREDQIQSLPREQRCRIPGTSGDQIEERDLVTVEVQSQLHERRAEDAVYCSCRCDGRDPNARYCTCPSGFECREVPAELALFGDELAGSYCFKQGTYVSDPNQIGTSACNATSQDCGDDFHPPL